MRSHYTDRQYRVKKPIGHFEIDIHPETFFLQSRSVFGFAKMSGEEDVILVAQAALIVDSCKHVRKKKKMILGPIKFEKSKNV